MAKYLIDIPEDRYKKLVNPYQYNEALCDELKEIVRKGIPLSLEYGRLIDSDAFKEYLKVKQSRKMKPKNS